ncbi:MAG: protocatechuate 3,4-dioxygenase [Chthoniobacterales bacterium]|nr:protocatechuate 3,4-dioxygenase [Chthoniobacterales bacterium]
MQALFARRRLDKSIVFVAALIIAATTVARSDKKPGYPPTLSGGAPCGSCNAPEKLSGKTVIPPEKEPGEPLVITGKIFQPDGKTPAEGMVLWVYHTDRTGYYNEQDDASHPRLNGWMKIGADGKYEFRTIRPGAYPHRSTPAHIHAHVYGPRYSERSIDDYWFKDDPRINEKELKNAADNGGHPVVVDLKRGSDGVWRGVRDIKLQGG